MSHPRFSGVILFFILTSCGAGCQTASPPQSTTAASPPPQSTTADTIRGTIRLRDGATFPRGATLSVEAVWFHTGKGEQVFHSVSQWPVAFAIPVDWPQFKGFYSDNMYVYAKAELNGQTILITESKLPDPPPPYGDGKPVDLVLIPAIE
jgi:uncharacterized lipoprotein YbaY